MNPLNDRVWVAEYMPGVRADANIAAYASLVDLLEHSCERFRTLTAFQCADATLTYAELDQRAAMFASFLQHECKLERGERVAIMLSNILQYPVTLFGVLRAGMVAVNINPQLDAYELERQLDDCGARTIVILNSLCPVLGASIDRTAIEYVVTTEPGDLAPPVRRVLTNMTAKRARSAAPTLKGAIPFRTTLTQGERHAYKPTALGSSDLALLQYTSGTTGVARAAMLTHGNLVANVMQNHAMFASRLTEGAEVIVTARPLHDPFALTLNCLLSVMIGARNALISDANDIQALLRTFSESRATLFAGNGALFAALLEAPGFSGIDFERLKLVFGSGAIPHAVAENWRLVTGIPITPLYGLTEAGPVVCSRPMHRPDMDGTVGIPLPSTTVSIRDGDNEPAAAGVLGELCVRGPQVMQGYWRKPDDTEHAMTVDGFLRTGDLATMSETGYVTIIDRKADLITAESGDVVPNEIESILALHPAVREVACIGVAHAGTEPTLTVFVVKSDPALSADALKEFSRKNLTGRKVPASIEFRESLPKSAAGNILRRALR